jgi:hypothetical protein
MSVSHPSIHSFLIIFGWYTAKKEDNPEEALKEFRAIVDQESEKGDWYDPSSFTPFPQAHQPPQGIQSPQTIHQTPLSLPPPPT